MGVTVKVTVVPAQMEVELAAIVTEGVTVLVVILIVIVLEVAVVTLAQLTSEVSIQVMTSPLAKLDELYVLLLLPTVPPFRFH